MPERFRSLLALIGLVALAALGLAAIRSSWVFSDEIFPMIELVLLLVAVLLARSGPRRARTFWFGFALFGGIVHLETDPALARLYNPRMFGHRSSPFGRIIAWVGQEDFPISPLLRSGNRLQAVRIAQVTMNLALGVVGGLAAVVVRRLGRRSRARPPRPAGRGQAAGRVATIALVLTLLALPAVARSLRPVPAYFPKPGQPEAAGLDPFHASWYARSLAAMGEPSLLDLARADPTAESYRFLDLPEDRPGIGIRVTRTARGASLRLVALDGILGEPGAIALDRTITLRPDQWDALVGRIAEAEFWDRPPTPPPPGPGELADFDQQLAMPPAWVVEGVRAGRYRVDDENHPREAWDAKEMLIYRARELTGVDLEEAGEAGD